MRSTATLPATLAALAIVCTTSVAAADDPPRVVVTVMAGGGNEFWAAALGEVRLVEGLYGGVGYTFVIHPSELVYHGPSIRAGYRLGFGDLFAITPRVGIDILASAVRFGSTEYQTLVDHSPVAPIVGVMAGIYPSVFVIGAQVDAGFFPITMDTTCNYAAVGNCATGAETAGSPTSEVLIGVHAGLVLGVAF